MQGKVLAVMFEDGEKVNRGDTLLIVDTDLLKLKRNQAASSINGIDARINATRSQLKQAERALELQEQTLARVSALAKDGSATVQQVDELTTQRNIAKDQIKAVKDNIEALYAEKETIIAGLAVFDRQIEDGVLTAPTNGTVLTRMLEVGEMAVPGMVAFRLANLDNLKLRVYLSEQDVNLVKLGQSVKIKVDALPQKEFQGRVEWVSSEAEFTPKNVQTKDARSDLVYAIKVNVQNSGENLHIGMPAEVVF